MVSQDTPTKNDWTVNPNTGHSNSSTRFLELCYVVGRLIFNNSRIKTVGEAEILARLIMAQLAHEHSLAPSIEAKKTEKVELFEFTHDEAEEPSAITKQINTHLTRLNVSPDHVISIVQLEGITRVFYTA